MVLSWLNLTESWYRNNPLIYETDNLLLRFIHHLKEKIDELTLL